MYAIQMARHYFYPDTKKNGLFGLPKLIVFTSEHVSIAPKYTSTIVRLLKPLLLNTIQSHYSVQKAVAILGIGTEQTKLIPVDKR
jgi:hypothetical protein